MSSVLPLAVFGIIGGVLLARRPHRFCSNQLSKIISNLSWRAGIMLLFVNLIIIGLTVLSFLSSSYLVRTSRMFPIIIFSIISFGAPLLSVYAWLRVKYLIGSNFQRRLVASILGQSVYWLLLIYFIYRYATVKPMYPGGDAFMQAFGFMIAGFICFCATLIGIVALSSPLPKKGS